MSQDQQEQYITHYDNHSRTIWHKHTTTCIHTSSVIKKILNFLVCKVRLSRDPSDDIINGNLLSNVSMGTVSTFFHVWNLRYQEGQWFSVRYKPANWSALIVCQTVWLLVKIILHKYRTYSVPTSSKKTKALDLLCGL